MCQIVVCPVPADGQAMLDAKTLTGISMTTTKYRSVGHSFIYIYIYNIYDWDQTEPKYEKT